MIDFYILDEFGNPVPCPDTSVWARWMVVADKEKTRAVSQDTYPDGSFVSTVFLGIRHPGGIYETMIFGGIKLSKELDQYQTRCSTREEAIEQHLTVCKIVEENLEGKL